jgi:hypothetical protein
VFRPTPGTGRPETPIERLYLASASAHPGGGVHGGPGANAARAALRAGTTGRLALAATRVLVGRPQGRTQIGGDGRAVEVPRTATPAEARRSSGS